MTGTKHVQVRLTDAEYLELRTKAGKKGSGIQPFVHQLVIDALHADRAEPPYPYASGNKELHDKLERVLNSGDDGTIRAVVPNIEIFFDRLKPQRGAAKPAAHNASAEDLTSEEKRLIDEYRSSSFEKRSRMLGFAAKQETLEPEVMPGSGRSARRTGTK